MGVSEQHEIWNNDSYTFHTGMKKITILPYEPETRKSYKDGLA